MLTTFGVMILFTVYQLFKKHFFDVSVSYTGLQTDEVIHKFKEIIINEVSAHVQAYAHA